MKDIKFRVFIKGNYTYFNLDLLNRESRAFYNNEILGQNIEQYTGKKDSKGIDIYSGDKLKCKYKDIFANDSFGYTTKIVMWGECSWWMENSYMNLAEFLNYGECEVVGSVNGGNNDI